MNFITDEYVGLYFYSAVFQGNMALLALVGVFAVFRIQLLRSLLDETGRSLVQITRDYYGMHSSIDKFPQLQTSDINKLRQQLEEPNHRKVSAGLIVSDSYRHTCDQYDSLTARLTSVKSKVKTPFWLTIVVIGLSLVLLPLAHFINLNLHSFEPWLIIMIVVANAFALYKNVSFVIWALD